MTPAAVLSLVNVTTGAATGAPKAAAAVAAAGRSRAGGNPEASADNHTANDGAQGFGRHLRDEQGRRLAQQQASTAEATRPAVPTVLPGTGAVAVGVGVTAASTVAGESAGPVPNTLISSAMDDRGAADTVARADLHRVDGLAAPADPVGRVRSGPPRPATRDAGSRSAGDAASSDALNQQPNGTAGDARGQGPNHGSALGQDTLMKRRIKGNASVQPAAGKSGPAQSPDSRPAGTAPELEALTADAPQKARLRRTAGLGPADSASAAGAEPLPAAQAAPSTTRPEGPTGPTTASGMLADSGTTADAMHPTGPASRVETVSARATSPSGATAARAEPPTRHQAEPPADQPAESRRAALGDATRAGLSASPTRPAQAATSRSVAPDGSPAGPVAAEPALPSLTTTVLAASRANGAGGSGANGAVGSGAIGAVAADPFNPAGPLASSRAMGGDSAAETKMTSRPRAASTAAGDAIPASGAGLPATPGAAVVPGVGEVSVAVLANRPVAAAPSTAATGTSSTGPARAVAGDSPAAAAAATGSRAASGNDATLLANLGLGQPSAPAVTARPGPARVGGSVAGLAGAAASAGAASSAAAPSPSAAAASSPSGSDVGSLAIDRAGALLANPTVNGISTPLAGSDGTGASMTAALSASSRSDGALAAATYVAVAADVPTVTVPTPIDSPYFAASLASQVSLLTRDGIERAEVRLNPAEMGPVQVRIQIDGRDAQVEFSADMAATRQILETSLPQLASSLREAGFTLSGGGVFQQPSSERQAGGSNDPGQGRSGGNEQRPGRGTRSDDGSLATAAGVAVGAAQRQRTAAANGRLDLYA